MLKKLRSIFLIIVFILQWLFNFYILNELHKVSDYKPLDNSYNEENNFSSSKDITSKQDNAGDIISLENDMISTKDRYKKDYLGVISIDKIDLKTYLYDKTSQMNSVDKGIEILGNSDMPDKDKGNLILASHSGSSSIAYFHRLDEINVGDLVNVDYNSNRYSYKIAKIYDISKTGKLVIDRDYSKSTLTMITCKGYDKQLVVVGYMI